MTATVLPVNTKDPSVTWSVDNEAVATIDENTGVATGLRRGTAEIIAVDSESFESAPATLVVNDVTVSFPDTDVNSTDIFTVPLLTTDISGLGVNSFETDIQFDPGVLQFEGVDQTGTHYPSLRKAELYELLLRVP